MNTNACITKITIISLAVQLLLVQLWYILENLSLFPEENLQLPVQLFLISLHVVVIIILLLANIDTFNKILIRMNQILSQCFVFIVTNEILIDDAPKNSFACQFLIPILVFYLNTRLFDCFKIRNNSRTIQLVFFFIFTAQLISVAIIFDFFNVAIALGVIIVFTIISIFTNFLVSRKTLKSSEEKPKNALRHTLMPVNIEMEAQKENELQMFYREVLGYLSQGLMIQSYDGQILYANHTVFQLLAIPTGNNEESLEQVKALIKEKQIQQSFSWSSNLASQKDLTPEEDKGGSGETSGKHGDQMYYQDEVIEQEEEKIYQKIIQSPSLNPQKVNERKNSFEEPQNFLLNFNRFLMTNYDLERVKEAKERSEKSMKSYNIKINSKTQNSQSSNEKFRLQHEVYVNCNAKILRITFSHLEMLPQSKNERAQRKNPISSKLIGLTSIRKSISNISNVLIIIEDFTQLFRSNRMRHMLHSKNEFLASISHQLQTPLNCSIGLLNTITPLISNNIFENFIQPALASNKILHSTLSDLLDFSDIENSNFQYQFVRADLYTIIQEILSIVKVQAKIQNIHIEVLDALNILYREECSQFITDRRRLCQVILNLVLNSIKFSGRNGKLALEFDLYQKCASPVERSSNRVHRKEGKEIQFFLTLNKFLLSQTKKQAIQAIVVQVIDKGFGISPEKLIMLRDQLNLDQQNFSHEQSQLKKIKGARGFGLGLTISNQILSGLTIPQRKQRPIAIESVEGQGSKFEFILLNQQENLPPNDKALSLKLQSKSSLNPSSEDKKSINESEFNRQSIFVKGCESRYHHFDSFKIESSNEKRQMSILSHDPCDQNVSFSIHYDGIPSEPKFLKVNKVSDLQDLRVEFTPTSPVLSRRGDNIFSPSNETEHLFPGKVINLAEKTKMTTYQKFTNQMNILQHIKKVQNMDLNVQDFEVEVKHDYQSEKKNTVELCNQEEYDQYHESDAKPERVGSGDFKSFSNSHSGAKFEGSQSESKKENLSSSFEKSEFYFKQNYSIDHNCVDSADVLIVDDIEFNTLTLASMFSEVLIKTDICFNGFQAIERIQTKFIEKCSDCRQFYQLILMDIDMPLKDGYQTTLQINSLLDQFQILHNTSIVACSAYVGSAEIVKAKQCGMKDYISKPVFPETIKQLIQKYSLYQGSELNA